MTEVKQSRRFSIYTAFCCFIAVYMSVREVLPLNFLIESAAVSGAIFVCAFVLIIIDLFTEQQCLKGRISDLLIFFIAFCAISSVVNIKYGFFGNLKVLGALAIEFLFFYPFAKGKNEQEIKHTLNILSAVLIITWCVFTLLSLSMFFFSVDYLVRGVGSWGIVNQGFSSSYDRLWGIFQDPNYASTICAISVFLSARLIAQKKGVVTSILLVLNIIIQMSYIALGGSRACIIILSVGTVLVVLWKTVFASKISAKKLCCGILISALSVAAVFGSLKLLKNVLPVVRTGIVTQQAETAVNNAFDKFYSVSGLEFFRSDDTDVSKPSDPDFTPDGNQNITRTDLENMNDISNGRFKRWKETIKIFLKSPIFGASPRNISEFAKEHCPDTLMAMYGIASHNGYLDVLVSTGIIGFIILAAAVLLGVIKILAVYFAPGSSTELCWLTAQLAMLALSAFFVSDVFMSFSMGAFLFWLYFGMAQSFSPKNDTKSLFGSIFNKIFRRKEKE